MEIMELTWSDFFEDSMSEMCLYYVYVCLSVCAGVCVYICTCVWCVCEEPYTVPGIY